MNKLNFTSSIISITVAAALLSGCSATPVTPTDAATPVATAAPIDIPDAPEATLTAGDLVDEADVKTILKAGKGQRAYPLADGTFMVVTKTEPLPEAVQADANAKSAVIATNFANGAVDADATIASMETAKSIMAIGTGKIPIMVWSIFGYPESRSEVKSMFWTIGGGPGNGGTTYPSRAAAQGVVDSYLAGKDNAVEFVVVYSD